MKQSGYQKLKAELEAAREKVISLQNTLTRMKETYCPDSKGCALEEGFNPNCNNGTTNQV